MTKACIVALLHLLLANKLTCSLMEVVIWNAFYCESYQPVWYHISPFIVITIFFFSPCMPALQEFGRRTRS